jgi:hypothetical protein
MPRPELIYATVAVARRLLTLVYHGLRDGHIPALAAGKAA